jgi:TonB family protein
MRRFVSHLLRPVAPVLVSALMLAGPTARAQETPASEPRFVSGPDSLRALLGRVQQQANPELRGQLFLKLDLNKDGVPSKAYYIVSESAPAWALARNKDAQASAQKLLSQLPPWQLAPGPATEIAPSVVLPLTFGPVAAPLPLLYSDEKPVFPFATSSRVPRGADVALNYIQRNFRYPAQDLRNGVQGTVYLYYEVSETGAIEQRRVVGSLSYSIDAEALRVLQTLPNATTPPRHQGRPVRVAYVAPINLRIM